MRKSSAFVVFCAIYLVTAKPMSDSFSQDLDNFVSAPACNSQFCIFGRLLARGLGGGKPIFNRRRRISFAPADAAEPLKEDPRGKHVPQEPEVQQEQKGVELHQQQQQQQRVVVDPQQTSNGYSKQPNRYRGRRVRLGRRGRLQIPRGYARFNRDCWSQDGDKHAGINRSGCLWELYPGQFY